MLTWLNQRTIQECMFTSSQQRGFLEDLLSLLQDGISVSQAIDIMIEAADGLKRQVAESISYSLASGQGMAPGMTGWFSPIYIELVRSGEQTGLMKDVLTACIQSVNRTSRSLMSCVTTLVYPTLVVLVALGVLVFVKQSVFEQFVTIKPVAQWPAVSQSVYTFASTIQDSWKFFCLFIAFAIALVSYLMLTVTGKVRGILDCFPLFRLYRQLTAARFMQTLALLLMNGVMLKKALLILQAKSRVYMGWHLLKMEMQLANGQLNIAEILDSGLIDESDMRRLRIVGKGVGFPTALHRLGQQSFEKKMRVLLRFSNMLGGFLLLMGAVLAMLLVLSIYSVSQVLSI